MTNRPIRAIRGERVYLRPLEPGDAELIHHWFEDARVHTLMGDLPRSLAWRRQSAEEAAKDDGRDVFRFIICQLVDDRPIGRTDLFEIDRTNGSAALGITIGEPALWGRGLGTDAVNALVDLAFGQLRMERVWLDTDADNARAQAAYTKAGFSREGILRHAWFQDGHWSDDIRMSLLRDEWAALPRRKSWERVEAAIAERSADE
jgi:RimJ/RimL family protein N-acetyltransferase